MSEKPSYEELERRVLELERHEHYRDKAEPLAFPQFEKHDAIILIINPDSGIIIDANIAAQKYYGYSIKTLKQMKIQEINMLSPDKVAEKYQQAANNKLNYFEFPHRLSSGEIRTVEVHSSPILVKGKKLLLSIIHDITVRNKAEEVQRKKDRLQQSIIQTAIDGFWLVDKQGRLKEVNDTYCRMSGYSRQELLSMSIPDLEAAESNNDIAAHIKKVIEQGAERFETRHRRKDGDIFDVEVSTQYLHEEGGQFVVFLRDISERKQAEAERENKIRVLEILNAGNDIRDIIRGVLSLIQEISGCEAIGIRLRDGEDFPYFETRGFPQKFVKAEQHLCVQDLDGQLLRDEVGNPVLECMCGNIICGRFDPSKPFFTGYGSFLTNSTTELLASTTEQDRQARTRNRCNAEGYESVLLVPLRAGGETFGLLQLNDHRKGRFSDHLVAQMERLAENVSTSLAQIRANNALKESKEFLDNLNDIAYTADDKGTLTWVNPSSEKITGFPAKDMIGKSFFPLFLDRDHESLAEVYKRTLMGESLENTEL